MWLFKWIRSIWSEQNDWMLALRVYSEWIGRKLKFYQKRRDDKLLPPAVNGDDVISILFTFVRGAASPKENIRKKLKNRFYSQR